MFFPFLTGNLVVDKPFFEFLAARRSKRRKDITLPPRAQTERAKKRLRRDILPQALRRRKDLRRLCRQDAQHCAVRQTGFPGADRLRRSPIYCIHFCIKNQ